MARPTFIWSAVSAVVAVVAAPGPPQAPGPGGVALPGDWWRESVPMQSMDILRGSVSGIDETVEEIARIRKDVALTQEDLKDQEVLWHQAEAQLRRENAELQAQVMKLRQQREEGVGLAGAVAELREQLEEVKKENETLTWEFEVEAQQAKVRQQTYDQRAMQLDEYLASIEQAALAEDAEIHKQKLLLQENTAQLELEQGKLQAKLNDLERELQLQKVEMEAKTQDLRNEANSTEEELMRVKDKVVPAKKLKRELLEFQSGLRHESGELLRVKQEEVEAALECKRRRKEINNVLSVEQEKASQRHQSMLAICTRAHTERGALEQALHACEQR